MSWAKRFKGLLSGTESRKDREAVEADEIPSVADTSTRGLVPGVDIDAFDELGPVIRSPREKAAAQPLPPSPATSEPPAAPAASSEPVAAPPAAVDSEVVKRLKSAAKRSTPLAEPDAAARPEDADTVDLEGRLPDFMIREKETLALDLFARGQVDEAITRFRELLEIFQANGDRGGEASILANLGCAYRSRGDFARALYHFKRGYQLDTTLADVDAQVGDLLNLAGLYQIRGDLKLALETCSKAIELAKRLSDRGLEAFARLRWSTINLQLGDFAAVLQGLRQTLDLAAENPSVRGQAIGGLGELYHLMGEYDYALRCLSDARELLLAASQTGPALRIAMKEAEVLGDIGAFDAAWHLAGSVGESVGVRLPDDRAPGQVAPIIDPEAGLVLADAARSAVLAVMGTLEHWQGRHQHADEGLRQAQECFSACGNPRDRAGIMLTRGAVALSRDDSLTAKSCGEQVLEMAGDDPLLRLRARLLLLDAASALASEEESSRVIETHLEAARVEARKLHLPEETWRVHYVHGKWLVRQQRLQEAYAALRDAADVILTLRESLPEYYSRTGFMLRHDRKNLFVRLVSLLRRLGCNDEADNVVRKSEWPDLARLAADESPAVQQSRAPVSEKSRGGQVL
ncbi:MAG: tetratricopeptide repeat protein [Candidatus Schekmanbacteria bacterium]|nr:tetratricopeptide repeat protein [Candidatus Schekmanbacteria bacterium]